MMEVSESGSAQPAGTDADAPEHVAPDAVSSTAEVEEESVTRRRALTSASAVLAAATVMVTGGGEALAKAKGKTPAKSTAPPKGKHKPIVITVNGQKHTVKATPDTPLLYVLRNELHLRGAKFGCGLSECGACAVLLDGKQIRSCIWPVNQVGTKPIVTLDGLAAAYHGAKRAKRGALHPLQQAWIDEQVPQCGYCQSGMIIQAADLLAKKPRPTTAEIKTAMNGHLCRCGTYNGIIAAIHRASKEMAKK